MFLCLHSFVQHLEQAKLCTAVKHSKLIPVVNRPNEVYDYVIVHLALNIECK